MKQLRNQELSAFCEELAWLVHSGVGVGDGLRLMAEDEKADDRKTVYFEMAEKVDMGTSLADALKEAVCFPAYVQGSIRAGETMGRLEEALKALAGYYEEKERTNRYMKSALLQPVVLLLLMLIVVGVLLTRVIPTFQSVYESLGGKMTGIAGGLLNFGLWMKEKLWIFYVLLGLLLCLAVLFAAWQTFQERVIAVWKKCMGDRGVMRKVNDAALAQVISMGLASGLHLEDTMLLAAEVLADIPKAKNRCLRCRELLTEGIPLIDALKQSEVLPMASCRLLGVGMQCGNGDSVMEEISKKLSEEAETEMADRVDKVEPALVLTISVLVGVILLVVMLPLMNIMEAIG